MSVSAVLVGLAAWNASQKPSSANQNQVASPTAASSQTLLVSPVPPAAHVHWIQALADASRSDASRGDASWNRSVSAVEKGSEGEENISFPNGSPAFPINVALEEEK